ncbi:MAG: hypothetical protein KIS92_07605 [Planctomycetota bacterium]|nr:hypothetical protein [Planctomycetota bacterium]
MERGKKLAALVLLALFAGFLAYTASVTPTQPLPAPIPPAAQLPLPPGPDLLAPKPVRFTQSSQCIDCHSQIYAEWRKDQHATSWSEEIFRSFSINYTKDECLSCHAPKPMLEVGLTNAPVLRDANRSDGVDCITCHQLNGQSHGTLGSKAVCGGIFKEELKTSQACYHCHATHNLFKEYLASEYPARGVTCQDCHMEKVTRRVADGGPVRVTRRHVFHNGGHDVEGLKKALALAMAAKDGKLTVTVTNIGAGHGVPGEINNRVVRLEVSVQVGKGKKTEDGREVDDVDEVQAHEAIFRAPPRLARDKVPSTQILPGQPRVLEYALPVPRGRVVATLTYKLEASSLNDDATLMGRWQIDF